MREVLAKAAGDPPRHSEVLIVLGRELVADQPSRVFAARLDHGAELLAAGRGPRLLVTGGLTGRSSRTEAQAGKEYLMARGVPAEAVLLEDRSRHTLENLFNAREALRQAGWRTITLISDPLHLARAATLARGLGLDVACSPAPQSLPRPGQVGWWTRAWREAMLLHWYRAGVWYSRTIRSERLLSRVT